jgi:ribosomal protein S6--L-glutamate ligase
MPIAENAGLQIRRGIMKNRYVILTDVQLGKERFPLALTLTNRDSMRFRMLLGGTALKKRYMVDPARFYVLGRHKHKKDAAE